MRPVPTISARLEDVNKKLEKDCLESPVMKSLVRMRYLGNDYDIIDYVECDGDGALHLRR